jgi:hypothetical protein
MTGLQEAFYIIGIIFMGLMLIFIIALVIAVLKIRAKVNHIHDQIEAKIDTVSLMAEKGGALAGIAAKRVARQAKRAMNKK